MAICAISINIATAQSIYKFYPEDANSTQTISGNNKRFITINSNNSDVTHLKLNDKEDEQYGTISGTNNGSHFGLKDGDLDWSYLAVKDNYSSFKIDNSEIVRLKANGYVGIGTSNPQNQLDVCGIIRANEVLVEDTWCDFVFEPEYCLTTLEEEAQFIKIYGHLSNFESAKTMNGKINVNDIFKRQQIQIEENVLHLIQLNKANKALQLQVEKLTADYATLVTELAAIKAKLP